MAVVDRSFTDDDGHRWSCPDECIVVFGMQCMRIVMGIPPRKWPISRIREIFNRLCDIMEEKNAD